MPTAFFIYSPQYMLTALGIFLQAGDRKSYTLKPTHYPAPYYYYY